MAQQRVASPRDVSISDVLVPRASTTRMMVRAFAKRCPRCGGGHLFTRWVRMVDRCGRCGYRFDRNDEGFFLGAYMVNLLLTEMVIFVFFIWFIIRENSNPEAPVVAVFCVAMSTAVLLPVFLYPLSRTVWAALHLANDPLELTEIIDAVDALGARREVEGGPAVSAGESDGGRSGGPDTPEGPEANPKHR